MLEYVKEACIVSGTCVTTNGKDSSYGYISMVCTSVFV